VSSIRPGSLLMTSNPGGVHVMTYDRSAISGSSDPWLALIRLAEGKPEVFKHIPVGDPFLCIEVVWDQSDVNLNLCMSVLWKDNTYLMFCSVLEITTLV